MSALTLHRRTLGGAVINRACIFQGSEIGTLDYLNTPTFGATWELRVRLRQLATGQPNAYVSDFGNGAPSLIYGFEPNCYELFLPNNSTGNLVRVKSAPILDTAYHELRFSYAGSMLTAYTDGQLTDTLAVASLQPLPASNGQLILSLGGGWNGAIDFYRLSSSGTDLVYLPFNELPGQVTLNQGSLGGTVNFTQGGLNRELA